MNRQGPHRIVIKGTPGSGKSTLAKRLSSLLELPTVDLDSLHHGPNWSAPSPDAFQASVSSALEALPEGWIVDGNYDSKLGKHVIDRAEAIIWLDLPLRVKVLRLLKRSLCLLKRSLRRILRGVDLGNGNRETWRSQFASRDSIFLELVVKHRRHRQTWPTRFGNDPRLVRLRSDREIEHWIDDLARSDV